jgi:Family of unknown function (DUF6335)
MAKRKATRRAKPTKKRQSATRRGAVRSRKASPRRKGATKPAKKVAKKVAKQRTKRAAPKRESRIPPGETPRLDRERRTLSDVVQTPPSSLNMDRHGSAAASGRAEMAQHRRQHGHMGEVTSGDPDVNVDTAYFSGDEAPGGDNPTPDQDIVDDIGKALGVEYNDNEELRSADKVGDRDKHRWELDPASAEDYKERD